MGLGPIATPLHASYTCDNAEGRPLPGPPLRLDRCGNALSAQGVSLRLEINPRRPPLDADGRPVAEPLA